MTTCPSCFKENAGDVANCPHCGADIPELIRKDESLIDETVSDVSTTPVPSDTKASYNPPLRFELISVFQLMVPLCITLALWGMSPGIGVLFGLPALLSTLATALFVYRQAKSGQRVPFVQRMDIFTQAFAIVVLTSVAIVIAGALSYLIGHLLGGVLGGTVFALVSLGLILAKLGRHLNLLQLASAFTPPNEENAQPAV